MKYIHTYCFQISGKDYIGNSYFEIPAEPSAGKRKPTRWYNPPKGQDFQDPIPAEWEAWLRMRRYLLLLDINISHSTCGLLVL